MTMETSIEIFPTLRTSRAGGSGARRKKSPGWSPNCSSRSWSTSSCWIWDGVWLTITVNFTWIMVNCKLCSYSIAMEHSCENLMVKLYKLCKL